MPSSIVMSVWNSAVCAAVNDAIEDRFVSPGMSIYFVSEAKISAGVCNSLRRQAVLSVSEIGAGKPY